MGFLERWGALDHPAPLAQQAAQGSLQTAPKASSTPCSHRRTRTVSVTLEGWGGKEGQNLESPLPQKNPVKQTVREWGLGLARRGDRWWSPNPRLAPGACPCLCAQLLPLGSDPLMS